MPSPQHVVLLPGLNNTRTVFAGVLAAWPAGIQAHALDNPALDSVEAIAEAHLAQLPDRFWLAGFSFGGYVALAMLAQAPERVQGIALLCSTPYADAPEAAAKRLVALDAVAQGRYLELVDAQADNAFHPDSLGNAALMQARRAMVRDYGSARYAAHVRATAARPDLTHLLDGRRPTLVVAASHDKVFPPEQVARWANAIAGARAATIDGAGHLAPMEKPDAVARVLAEWIEAEPTGRAAA
ncbi:alpha/beta fold hydrolase [Ottowia testudinis]|uniref:Alpha/beta fold hydrolase n=2 Tax=Ottowia testudinis TaxID=2816950 RepID=A0A975H5E6_9BURK|nr:alpha/beta fold hydrolase [Ottowia testudinis]